MIENRKFLKYAEIGYAEMIYNDCRWRYAPVGVIRLKEEEEEEQEEEEENLQ